MRNGGRPRGLKKMVWVREGDLAVCSMTVYQSSGYQRNLITEADIIHQTHFNDLLSHEASIS